MSGYIDLMPYAYDRNNENGKAVNVGWLSQVDDFTIGDTPPELLAALIAWPITNLYRGWHNCDLCGGNGIVNGRLDIAQNGNGDIRVPGLSGVVYVAPALVTHYISAHRYLPPQEFIDAVLAATSERSHD